MSVYFVLELKIFVMLGNINDVCYFLRFKIIVSFGKKICFNLIVILRNQEYFTIFLPILPLFLLFPTKFNNIIY